MRYSWYVDHYIQPALGDIPLRRLRPDHLDALYADLSTRGGRSGSGLAPKTINDVHVVIRSSLGLAVRRQLLETNIALAADARQRRVTTKVARAWTAQELAAFLAAAHRLRLYPALHLTAFTGMRRGEVAGLKWSDLDLANDRLSITRTIQNVAGRPVEFDVKTRTSRRCLDLDAKTVNVLANWRRRLYRDGLRHGPDDWMFLNTAGRFVNPESLSQLFDRTLRRTPSVPHIRFHDLRVRHEAPCIRAG